jgi:pyrimidine deaminase RibD-like protein
MLTIELFEQQQEPVVIKAFRAFLPIAIKHLRLKSIPKIKLVKELHDTHIPTFGRYSNEDKTVYVVVANRNPTDIIRTLAHELVHFKQGEGHELDDKSWHTGSTVENEANADAGIMMREFDDTYPEFLKSQPVELPGSAGTNESTETIHINLDREQLDTILVKLCALLIKQNKNDTEDYYGMVAAAVLDPEGNSVLRVNHADVDGERIHAERVAIDAYEQQYGKVPQDSIIITTLSPCNQPNMPERHGSSCTDYINSTGIKQVYCGYTDPTQHDTHKAQFVVTCTDNSKIQALCKDFADTFLAENYKDGKKPGRKGLAKRMGVDCSKSVTALRKIAKNSSGEKQRMAHWCANMKAGKK